MRPRDVAKKRRLALVNWFASTSSSHFCSLEPDRLHSTLAVKPSRTTQRLQPLHSDPTLSHFSSFHASNPSSNMLEGGSNPLLALLPSVVSTTPATEAEESPQAMEATRPVEEEALPLDRQHEVELQEEIAGRMRGKVEQGLNEQHDQLPTPSPSSHSTLSSAKLAAPPSPSFSTASTHSKRKRPSSRALDPIQTEEEKEDETKGQDGKEYQLCGMYYSHGITPKNPSLSRINVASSTSSPRARRSTTVSYSWRTIKPSKETILPPPIHYGLMLLGEAPEVFRKMDEPDSEDEEEANDDSEDEEDGPECSFKLPFDILRDFYYAEDAVVSGKGGQRDEPTEDVEKRESSRKPAHYRHLQTNFYVDRKPDRIDVAAVCMCQPPEDKAQLGCLETCINRMMQYCCDPKICPCGAQCSNVPLNKRQTIEEGKNGLKTGNRGFGLKTMVPIRKGELVIEYRGEIISRDESYKRVLNEYKDRSDYYFLEYDSLEVIDAGQKGNSSRFINHSCGPNCEVVRWRLASVDEYQVGIFAKRDIQAGEELTYNYGWQNFVDMADPNSEKPPASTSTSIPTSASPRKDKASKAAEEAANDIVRQRCFCGSPVCSGYLGGKPKDERALAAELSSKAKGKVKASLKAVEVKEKSVKEKKQPPVKLEWVKAKIVLPANSGGRKMSDRAASEESEGGVKKKLKSSLSGLSRAGSLRGAAAKAKEKLTGQR
ncbi:hypothetical protein JCM3765_004902 [Sporobolomyces pararoseus]